MDHIEVGYEGVDWIQLDQDRVQGCAQARSISMYKIIFDYGITYYCTLDLPWRSISLSLFSFQRILNQKIINRPFHLNNVMCYML